MAKKQVDYPATLDIDYLAKRDKVTTFFRLLYAVPILIVSSILLSSSSETFVSDAGTEVTAGGWGIVGGLFGATLLMILFRQKYPKWWFDFNLELNRFTTRISAYVLLLTDRYPSTDEEQAVHLDITYPDVKRDLNQWLPLVKWLLAFPHYVVLAFLSIAVVCVTIYAWFAILFTGKYPRDMFDFVVGVQRWFVRVGAYAYILSTDKYPPFSLK